MDQSVTTFMSGFLCVIFILYADNQQIAKRLFFDIWINNLDQDWIRILVIRTKKIYLLVVNTGLNLHFTRYKNKGCAVPASILPAHCKLVKNGNRNTGNFNNNYRYIR